MKKRFIEAFIWLYGASRYDAELAYKWYTIEQVANVLMMYESRFHKGSYSD